jgi:hypothetical protein
MFHSIANRLLTGAAAMAALLAAPAAHAEAFGVCVYKSVGLVRAVSSPAACRRGESFFFLMSCPFGNCAGVAGPAGPAGPQGAIGPAGPQGLQGPKGERGLTGATGLQGIAGLTGATGPQGPAGLTGATGPQGPAGLDGLTGAQGLKGDTGPQGLKGDAGAQGVAGAMGPQGVTGDTGPQGLPGPAGSSSGVSQAYTASVLRTIFIPTQLGFPTTVAQLDLPAGNYLIHAKSMASSQLQGGTGSVYCTLTTAGGLNVDAQRVETVTGSFTTLALAGPHFVITDSDTHLELQCSTNDPVNGAIDNAQLSAVQIKDIASTVDQPTW